MKKLIMAILFCLTLTSVALAQGPSVVIPKVSQGIIVDGRLKEEIWKQAAVFKLFYNVMNEQIAETQNLVFMMYDDKNLYIGFKFFEDDIMGIRSYQAKRDEPVFLDDSTELFIDVQNDGESPYYHVIINVDGTVYDEIGLNNPDWNLNFTYRACRVEEEKLWNVEMVIPFASLGVDCPEPGTAWGLNLARNRYRSTPPYREHSAWALTVQGFHQPFLFGQLFFGESKVLE